MTVSPKAKGWIRAAVDYGAPLSFMVAFLITRNAVTASWALVGGAAVALLVGYVAERRIAPMPLIAGVAALIFGGMTLIFHDERFIKIKPTVLNLGFAAFLLGGVATRRNPLKALLGETLRMPDDAWRTLTLRYGIFFLCVAVLNEAVWRTQSTYVWAWFRFPGLQILAILFSLTQAPLMMKHAKAADEEAPAIPPPPTE
ncbi:MAG: inner membrane-spanning protein YciB [Phenylobacterium sp.]|uniref:inner membrane-spanning protein YciB n=1 Tax=Phenylobacterium sp. TaxID=1871053 RepID=UPI002734B938|nr:inner membrane-spanning protein YciB [Phenylobacterium sp.]MDP3175567.1 inner membrane-spanning protein YciB [Phenylobacterium sp.]